MAKKTLNEAVVRRFQKLANLAPINEMYSKNEEYMSEEEMDEGMYGGKHGGKHHDKETMKEEEKHTEMEEMEMDQPEMDAEEKEEMEMDAAGELELTDDEAKSALEAIKDLEDLAAKLEAAMGELDLDDDEEEAEDKMEMDAMQEVETLEESEVDSMLEGVSYERSEQEIINEVAKRVAKRLQAAKLHEAKLNKALGRK